MLRETEISVVIPTYNRSHLLRRAVLSVLHQENDERPLEIIIVDNNSNDDTKDVVDSLASGSSISLRYLRENKQGNAHARNAGIQLAKGGIVAFIDDDVTVDKNWLSCLKRAFSEANDLSFVGGKVLPIWEGSPPSWLSKEHWSPLALLDYGPNPLRIAGNNPRCLLTANIAFRRAVFDAVGLFSPYLQRVKGSIGSMEDHEFLLRVCRSARKGLYEPHLIARGSVESERLRKAYHRRWHTGHGHFYALMRDPEWERSKFQLMGVPSHLYKQTAAHALTWFSRVVRNRDAAFIHECHLRFFRGFFVARQKERLGLINVSAPQSDDSPIESKAKNSNY